MSVVIPTVDSVSRIENTLMVVKDKCLMFQKLGLISNFEIIPVAQTSGDGTFALLHKYDTSIFIYPQYLSERGKGLACSFGAMKSKMSYVMFIDDDLNYGMNFLLDGIPLTQKYDIIIGSRVGRLNMPFTRRIASFAYRKFAHAMFDLKGIYDIQAGQKLLKRDLLCFKKHEFWEVCQMIHCSEVGYCWDTELLVKARMLGKRIAEVSIVYEYQESVLKVSRAWWEMGVDLIKLRRRMFDVKN